MKEQKTTKKSNGLNFSYTLNNNLTFDEIIANYQSRIFKLVEQIKNNKNESFNDWLNYMIIKYKNTNKLEKIYRNLYLKSIKKIMPSYDEEGNYLLKKGTCIHCSPIIYDGEIDFNKLKNICKFGLLPLEAIATEEDSGEAIDSVYLSLHRITSNYMPIKSFKEISFSKYGGQQEIIKQIKKQSSIYFYIDDSSEDVKQLLRMGREKQSDFTKSDFYCKDNSNKYKELKALFVLANLYMPDHLNNEGTVVYVPFGFPPQYISAVEVPEAICKNKTAMTLIAKSFKNAEILFDGRKINFSKDDVLEKQ